MTIYESIIKINRTDISDRRAQDIAAGIGYASALLMDEYGWQVDAVVELLERTADDVADEAARRAE